ncbi:MAG TPA: dihydroxy-acid dehydratase, partial [Acidimicrobiales bacterium]|nr:dihydroxy-acid dehydratase [Acidimicrobiales bacterium]
HCMTMGTASTMACIAEALGMQLPGASCLPAVDARRVVLAEETGVLAVSLATHGPKPSEIMTKAAFENAIVVNAAIGGSTNAIIHLLAIARRVGVGLNLNDFDEVGRRVPLLVDLMPSGQFLMEDLSEAGGLPAVVKELRPWLHSDVTTVTGASLLENCRGARNDRPEVIRSPADPVQPAGSGTAVLFGTLAPRGAVIKVSAASPRLLAHRGPALVFDRVEDYLAVVDDTSLAVSSETVIVVRNCGPKGYPGMPEVGNLPLPRVVLERGVTDMVRISDARMSGTAYGTCVLHTAPEAAVGGPLGLVQTGDIIALDVANRRLDLEVDEHELERRSEAWAPPSPAYQRGWAHLYVESVLQADEGADLAFLVGSSGHATPRAAF